MKTSEEVCGDHLKHLWSPLGLAANLSGPV